MPWYARQHSAVSCAKLAEPINLPFGLWTLMSRMKHKFNRICQWRQCAVIRGHIGATWRMRLNRPSAAAMRLCVNLLWPLVYPLLGACPVLIFYLQLTLPPLNPDVTSRSFFQVICQPSSCLYHLLVFPLYVIHLPCLGSEHAATRFTRRILCTKILLFY